MDSYGFILTRMGAWGADIFNYLWNNGAGYHCRCGLGALFDRMPTSRIARKKQITLMFSNKESVSKGGRPQQGIPKDSQDSQDSFGFLLTPMCACAAGIII